MLGVNSLMLEGLHTVENVSHVGLFLVVCVVLSPLMMNIFVYRMLVYAVSKV